MKKSKKGEAKFFCESCGSEVPSHAKVCPVCGKFFASVKCPKCGRTGSSEEFLKGCPTCGYAMKPEELYGYDPDEIESEDSNKKNKSKNKKRSFFSSTNKENGYQESSLPLWIYIVPLVILIGLIIGLYSCI